VVDNFFVNHPAEELMRHRGRFVAWSMDGRIVLASAAGMKEAFAEARRLGLGDDEYTVEYVPEDA
jgi:hypothetical protein